MDFWKNKKTNIKQMKDLEAGFWQLLNKEHRIGIIILIEKLISMTNQELIILNEEKIELENKIKLSNLKNSLSPKFEIIRNELIELKVLFEYQLNLININNIKDKSEEELKNILNGDRKNQEFSQTSNKITSILHLLEINEEELENILKSNSNRFIIEENTIHDILTKITWEKDLNKSGLLTYENALLFVKNQNKEAPTREDWWNLTNEIGTWNSNIYTGYPKEKDLKRIGFENFSNIKFIWVPEVYDYKTAWDIHFVTGYVDYNNKSNSSQITTIQRNN